MSEYAEFDYVSAFTTKLQTLVYSTLSFLSFQMKGLPFTFVESRSKGQDFFQLFDFLHSRRRGLLVGSLLILFSVSTRQIEAGTDPWREKISFKTFVSEPGTVC